MSDALVLGIETSCDETAIGIVRGPHLIVMDEPTNHMDLPGIRCLEEALADRSLASGVRHRTHIVTRCT